MDTDDIKTYALIGGIGLGAYLLYKAFSGVKTVVCAVTAPATAALANWYVSLTSCGAAIPTGQVLLPNGTAVPVAQLQVSSVAGTNSAMFTYGGQTYYLNSPHDSNGNWAASLTLGC
jgi:hypothetical protein